jgi:hypothetical protein
MARLCRSRSQLPDRHDDPQPHIGALDIASAAHFLDHLARLRRGVAAVLLDPEMRGAADVEVGWGHALLDHLHILKDG